MQIEDLTLSEIKILTTERDEARADAARLAEAIRLIESEVSAIAEARAEEVRNDLTSGDAGGWCAAAFLVSGIFLPVSEVVAAYVRFRSLENTNE